MLARLSFMHHPLFIIHRHRLPITSPLRRITAMDTMMRGVLVMNMAIIVAGMGITRMTAMTTMTTIDRRQL